MGKFYEIYSGKLTFGLALTMNKRLMPLTYAEAGFQHNTIFESRILPVLVCVACACMCCTCLYSLCLKLASLR